MKGAGRREEDVSSELTKGRTEGCRATDTAFDHPAVEEEARWLAAIVESSDDAIVGMSLDGFIVSWNKGAERTYGYLADEVVGKPVTILIPPDRHNEEPAILERIRRGERVDHYETVRQRKDGRLVDISLTVSPVKNAGGTIIGASKIARDISERKRNEAQIAMLVREAEHRSKNVLATVQATIYLSHADTPDGLKRVIAGRIQALANVHRLFVETRWTGAKLHNLIAQELSPYRLEGDGRMRLVGPDLMIEPNEAQAIAVVVHELATNAAKYGALSVPDGRLEVEWSQAANGQLTLHWTELNGPAVNPPTRQGFGTSVMESMVAARKGEIHFAWHSQGLSCEITMPGVSTRF